VAGRRRDHAGDDRAGGPCERVAIGPDAVLLHLPPGLYERLVTDHLDEILRTLDATRLYVDRGALDPENAHRVLARHVAATLDALLAALPGEPQERLTRQIETRKRYSRGPPPPTRHGARVARESALRLLDRAACLLARTDCTRSVASIERRYKSRALLAREKALDPARQGDQTSIMKLAVTHRPLASSARHLPALCLTIILALALDSSVTLAIGRGHGGGGFGGGHVGGGGFAGGHFGGFGGGHVGGFGGSFGGGRFGAGHFAGGRFGGPFGGRQFGRFPGGFHNFGNNRVFFHHGRGFHGGFAFGVPFGFPYYAYAPYPYPYYADPYCDPYSPWYNSSYCYWRYRAY
jgi:hypothetical protein